jgi:hypothetical protein
MTGAAIRSTPRFRVQARKLRCLWMAAARRPQLRSIVGIFVVYFEQNVMQENRREQRKLAMALVDSLGLESAISACRANGWDGVLQVICDTESKYLPNTGPYLDHV